MEEEKIARISHYYEQILKELGFDSDADSELRETPRRVAEDHRVGARRKYS